MAQGNGTAVDVQFFWRNVAAFSRVQTSSSKGLVHLKNINVVHSQASLLQHSRNGNCWSHTHDFWRNTNRRTQHILTSDWVALLFGQRTSHQQDGSSAIRDLRGVSGVGDTILLEGRLQLSQRLRSNTLSWSFVCVHHNGFHFAFTLFFVVIVLANVRLDGQNLRLEHARRNSLLGLGIGSSSKFISLGARNVVFGSHILVRDTHWNQTLGHLLILLQLGVHFRNRSGPVVGQHRLDTGADTAVNLATLDLVGDFRNGHQARRTSSVESNKCRAVWNTRCKTGTTVFGRTSGTVQHIAHGHVFNQFWVHVCLLQKGLQKLGQDPVRPHIFEAAPAALGNGRSVRADNDNIVRVFLQQCSLGRWVQSPTQHVQSIHFYGLWCLCQIIRDFAAWQDR
ncbi:hypothetical protein CLUG_04881 [Clavispora lusitaniae ATCC 42720]|uniref:Uncharacterized protein n=1 Tax=Clavispora lusitaniae (strain ATCC 42720) TaxID=306902 RepID=C4Y9J1_CLAL4|nr:uncharacterized protein CLUG_04881 [Clavispora lusitaniae ATCC 42720]EEQ40754.1 hypothetical protein CLUG_04881 [Clavispora lusitaniae ATCC 42720]